jgi:hypothetical protein
MYESTQHQKPEHLNLQHYALAFVKLRVLTLMIDVIEGFRHGCHVA